MVARIVCTGVWLLSWAASVQAQPLQGAVRAPVALHGQDRFELIDIDTLFYIENRGLTRVLVELNGHAFKLAADPEEVRRSQNAFPIPQHGEITFNIAAFIIPCDAPNPFDCDTLNVMEVRSQGPPGSSAEVIIGDLLLPGQAVAYAITELVPLPERFDLLRAYPNPFVGQTVITFTIPEERTTGLPVQLVIYDVTGRRIRRLVDEPRFPGTFRVEWDGRDEGGHPAASGVYVCRLLAGAFQKTTTLVRLR